METTAIDTSKLPIKVEYAGKTKRGDWECYQWTVTIGAEYGNKHGFWVLPYYCGLGHTENKKGIAGKNPYTPRTSAWETWNSQNLIPKKPSNDEILHSLILDASAADYNFCDWCAEYGYSDDSIKAVTLYKECCETAQKLRKYFGRETIKQLEEQLRDL